MNTTENNKLIAEFMGLRPVLVKPDVYAYSDLPFFSTTADSPEKIMDTVANYAKYNVSWDWLMPVVIKCFEKYDEVYSTNVFNSENHQFKLNDALLETNINSLYKVVVDFIKWYNEQQKQSAN